MLDDKDRKWLWESILWHARKNGPDPDEYPSTMRRLKTQYQAIILTVEMLARKMAKVELGDNRAFEYTVLPDVTGTEPQKCWRWRQWPNYAAIAVIVLITMAFGATINMFATQHSKDEEQIKATQAELGQLRSAIQENTKQVALMALNQNDTNDRIGQLQGVATPELLTGKSIYRYVTSLTPETITLELPDKPGKTITFPHGLTGEEYDQLKLNLSQIKK